MQWSVCDTGWPANTSMTQTLSNICGQGTSVDPQSECYNDKVVELVTESG